MSEQLAVIVCGKRVPEQKVPTSMVPDYPYPRAENRPLRLKVALTALFTKCHAETLCKPCMTTEADLRRHLSSLRLVDDLHIIAISLTSRGACHGLGWLPRPIQNQTAVEKLLTKSFSRISAISEILSRSSAERRKHVAVYRPISTAAANVAFDLSRMGTHQIFPRSPSYAQPLPSGVAAVSQCHFIERLAHTSGSCSHED